MDEMDPPQPPKLTIKQREHRIQRKKSKLRKRNANAVRQQAIVERAKISARGLQHPARSINTLNAPTGQLVRVDQDEHLARSIDARIRQNTDNRIRALIDTTIARNIEEARARITAKEAAQKEIAEDNQDLKGLSGYRFREDDRQTFTTLFDYNPYDNKTIDEDLQSHPQDRKDVLE